MQGNQVACLSDRKQRKNRTVHTNTTTEEMVCRKKNKFYKMRPIIEQTCYFDKSRRKDVTITRLQLGRCGLNHYLHLMKGHPDGNCNICNIKEDIRHYVLHCKGNPATEVREWQKSNDSVSTLEEVLENTELQEIIYHHAKQR